MQNAEVIVLGPETRTKVGWRRSATSVYAWRMDNSEPKTLRLEH
jgi:hypothetical protein